MPNGQRRAVKTAKYERFLNKKLPLLPALKVQKRATRLYDSDKLRTQGNDDYLFSLLYPKDAQGSRVPAILPVESATARVQTTGTINANATGYLKLILQPGETGNVLFYFNAAGDSDTTVLSATGGLGTCPVTSTVARSWRIVSAELKVWSIANSQSGAGLYSMSTVPGTMAIANINYDFARDQPDTVFGTHGVAFKGIYKPLDDSSFDFQSTSGSIANSKYCYPVFCASGCANAQPFAYSYAVNYEYLPQPAYTDLIAVAKSKVADPKLSMLHNNLCSSTDSMSQFQPSKPMTIRDHNSGGTAGSFAKLEGGMGYVNTGLKIFNRTLKGINKITSNLNLLRVPVGAKKL